LKLLTASCARASVANGRHHEPESASLPVGDT
jgi:hypothetical protein